jgi:hypothetical protein
VLNSLFRLPLKCLKVVHKWWWIATILIFFPLEKGITDFVFICDIHKTLVPPWPRNALPFFIIRRCGWPFFSWYSHTSGWDWCTCARDLRNIRGEVTEVNDWCTVLVENSEHVREEQASSGHSFHL